MAQQPPCDQRVHAQEAIFLAGIAFIEGARRYPSLCCEISHRDGIKATLCHELDHRSVDAPTLIAGNILGVLAWTWFQPAVRGALFPRSPLQPQMRQTLSLFPLETSRVS